MNYPYAVLDGNQSPEYGLMADSCHRTLAAAIKAASKANREEPNGHYYVAHWGASRWARTQSSPAHDPVPGTWGAL